MQMEWWNLSACAGHRAFCHSFHSVRIDAPAQGCAHSAAHRPHSNFKRQDTEGFYLDCPENQDHEYRLRAALAQIRTCKEKDLAKLAQFVRLKGGGWNGIDTAVTVAAAGLCGASLGVQGLNNLNSTIYGAEDNVIGQQGQLQGRNKWNNLVLSCVLL